MKSGRERITTGTKSGGFADMKTMDLKMNPQHYIVPGREKQPIELMRLGLTDEEFEGYCIGNVMKYILRYKHKGGQNDLRKAKEYIDFLIRAWNNEATLGDGEYLGDEE